MKNKTNEISLDKERELYEKALVEQVTADFEERRKARLNLERQWELNMNFLAGNQYCDFNSKGDIVDEYKTFYWQNRGVFNHIAPIIESRLARFARVLPEVSVRPRTDDDKDVSAANVAEKIIAENEKENARQILCSMVWTLQETRSNI